jgi:hypothetical protein
VQDRIECVNVRRTCSQIPHISTFRSVPTE